MSKREHDIAPRWLDLRQASIYCSVSRKTLMRLANAGEIVANRLGNRGKWIVDRDSLDAFFCQIMLGRKVKVG